LTSELLGSKKINRGKIVPWTGGKTPSVNIDAPGKKADTCKKNPGKRKRRGKNSSKRKKGGGDTSVGWPILITPSIVKKGMTGELRNDQRREIRRLRKKGIIGKELLPSKKKKEPRGDQ